jgi:hypothetical protein
MKGYQQLFLLIYNFVTRTAARTRKLFVSGPYLYFEKTATAEQCVQEVTLSRSQRGSVSVSTVVPVGTRAALRALLNAPLKVLGKMSVCLTSEMKNLWLLWSWLLNKELALWSSPFLSPFILFYFILFICAYNVWVISPPFSPPPP